MSCQSSKNRFLAAVDNICKNYFIYIFNYLTSNEARVPNDRHLLRELHNAGYLDENKYLDYCERHSQGDFDLEELHLPK